MWPWGVDCASEHEMRTGYVCVFALVLSMSPAWQTGNSTNALTSAHRKRRNCCCCARVLCVVSQLEAEDRHHVQVVKSHAAHCNYLGPSKPPACQIKQQSICHAFHPSYLRLFSFSQVHSLDSDEGDALQRLIRAVNCNFLALSATIGNAQQVCSQAQYDPSHGCDACSPIRSQRRSRARLSVLIPAAVCPHGCFLSVFDDRFV